MLKLQLLKARKKMVANPEMFPWGPWEVSQALIWRLVHMQPDWRRWELSSIRTARYHVERRNNLVQVKSCDGAELESTFVRIQKEVRWRARGNHELRHQRLKARKDFWFYSSIFAFNRTLIFFFFFLGRALMSFTELIQQMKQTWQRYRTKKNIFPQRL